MEISIIALNYVGVDSLLLCLSPSFSNSTTQQSHQGEVADLSSLSSIQVLYQHFRQAFIIKENNNRQ